MTKLNDSLSSSISYATICQFQFKNMIVVFLKHHQINKHYSYIEQILVYEKIYYENLKEYIIKYSRPLRRYLNPDEIVNLFQNIEKVDINLKINFFKI